MDEAETAMRSCRFLFSLAVAFALLWPPAALRAERYVVGVEESQYLPHYGHEGGAYAGFARAILDAYFSAKGHNLEYRALPVPRLYLSFIGGGVDFKYPDNALWKPEDKADAAVVYSDPVTNYVDGVSLRPERKGGGPKSIRTLGIIRGFTATAWTREIDAGHVTLVENDSFRGLVEQAIMGRVDGIFANIDVVQHLLTRELKTPGALVFDPALPHTGSYYHLSTIKHPHVIADFNAWMRENAASINALKQKHGVETWGN